jgi:hypothetical protein
MMAAMPPLLARSGAEAHMYIDMHPCECGAREFGNRVNEVTHSGGQWLSEFTRRWDPHPR